MKAIKICTGTIVSICLIILAGCSDNLVTTSNIEPTLASSTDSMMGLEDNSYFAKFWLSPGETQVFHYGNTNLILIHSYSVSNCNMVSRDLLIRSSNQADSTSLPCSWKKQGSFAFEDLSVKNISSQKKTISVSLRGLTFNN